MFKAISALLLFFICHHACAQDFYHYMKAEIQQLHTINADTVITLTKNIRDSVYSPYYGCNEHNTTWLFWKKSGQLFSRKYVFNETLKSNHVSRSTMIHCEKHDALNWLIQNDSVIMRDDVFPYIIQYTENGITKYDRIHIPDTAFWIIAIRIRNEGQSFNINAGYLLQQRDAHTPENINYSHNLNSPLYKALSILRIYAAEYNSRYVFKPSGNRRLKKKNPLDAY